MRCGKNYLPGCGDLEAYLDDRVRRTLHEQNVQYIKEFSQRSLEHPLSSDAGDGFCLCDTIAAPDSDWADSLDDQMIGNVFWSSYPVTRRHWSGCSRRVFVFLRLRIFWG